MTRFARLVDMEPGMWFSCRIDRTPLEFVGVERVESRFPGKQRVRVITRQGVSWINDRLELFPLVDWSGGAND